MELKKKRSCTQEAKDIRRAQKEAAGFLDRSTSSTPVKFISCGRRPDVILSCIFGFTCGPWYTHAFSPREQCAPHFFFPQS